MWISLYAVLFLGFQIVSFASLTYSIQTNHLVAQQSIYQPEAPLFWRPLSQLFQLFNCSLAFSVAACPPFLSWYRRLGNNTETSINHRSSTLTALGEAFCSRAMMSIQY